MRLCLTIALMVVMGGTLAAADYSGGYADFRDHSGLPGGGYGVSTDGRVGFAGAVQLSIPIGYTPGAGEYAAAGSATKEGGIPTDIGDDDVNSTLASGFGTTIRGHELWIADMEIGSGGWSAYNVQLRVLSERGTRPGVSIGVVDVLNGTPSFTTPDHGARSCFVAATRQLGDAEHPVWGTLGLGDGRFHDRLFAGISYQATPRWKAMAEYDGWGVNVGTAYDLGGGWHDGEWHTVLLAGLNDLDRVTVSLSVTRTGLRRGSR
jgi:hypothetical protein